MSTRTPTDTNSPTVLPEAVELDALIARLVEYNKDWRGRAVSEVEVNDAIAALRSLKPIQAALRVIALNPTDGVGCNPANFVNLAREAFKARRTDEGTPAPSEATVSANGNTEP